MPAMNLKNLVTGVPLRIPEAGTEEEALMLALDLKDLIRDNNRHSFRNVEQVNWRFITKPIEDQAQKIKESMRQKSGEEAAASYARRHERRMASRLEHSLKEAEKRADKDLPRAIRRNVETYLPNSRLSDFQRSVFQALSGFAVAPDAQVESSEKPMVISADENVLKATFHQAGRIVMIPADGNELAILTLALDLKDALIGNLRVEFTKQAAALRENPVDVPDVIKNLMNAGMPVGMVRVGPNGAMSIEDEVNTAIQNKLAEAIQKQSEVFLRREGMTPFQRSVIETFAGFAPANP